MAQHQHKTVTVASGSAVAGFIVPSGVLEGLSLDFTADEFRDLVAESIRNALQSRSVAKFSQSSGIAEENDRVRLILEGIKPID